MDEVKKYTIDEVIQMGTEIGVREAINYIRKEKESRRARGIEKFIINDPNPYILPDEKAASFLIQYHSETKSDYVRAQSVREPMDKDERTTKHVLVT